jgi:hypothetical protein
MTDLAYDPNSVESLIRKYLGGIRKPTAAQAGNVARVFSNASEINLEYVTPQTIVDVAKSSHVVTRIGPTTVTIGPGSDWITLAFVPIVNTGDLVMCEYEIKISKPPPYGYSKTAFTAQNYADSVTIQATHSEFSDSTVRRRAVAGTVALEVQQIGISVSVTYSAAYWVI